jgi:hypothetical protein
MSIGSNPFTPKQQIDPSREFIRGADDAGNNDSKLTRAEVEEFAQDFKAAIGSKGKDVEDLQGTPFQQAAVGADLFGNKDKQVTPQEVDALKKKVLEDLAEFGENGVGTIFEGNARC